MPVVVELTALGVEENIDQGNCVKSNGDIRASDDHRPRKPREENGISNSLISPKVAWNLQQTLCIRTAGRHHCDRGFSISGSRLFALQVRWDCHYQ